MPNNTKFLGEVAESFFDWAHKLESGVQVILDTSLPNKQQHKAASKLLHSLFVENSVNFKTQLFDTFETKSGS